MASVTGDPIFFGVGITIGALCCAAIFVMHAEEFIALVFHHKWHSHLLLPIGCIVATIAVASIGGWRVTHQPIDGWKIVLSYLKDKDGKNTTFRNVESQSALLNRNQDVKSDKRPLIILAEKRAVFRIVPGNINDLAPGYRTGVSMHYLNIGDGIAYDVL